jgi:hypothetical protein
MASYDLRKSSNFLSAGLELDNLGVGADFHLRHRHTILGLKTSQNSHQLRLPREEYRN